MAINLRDQQRARVRVIDASRTTTEDQLPQIDKTEALWVGQAGDEKPEAVVSKDWAEPSKAKWKEITPMKYNNKKGRLGVRRTRRSFIVRKRNIVPYGKQLHVRGVR